MLAGTKSMTAMPTLCSASKIVCTIADSSEVLRWSLRLPPQNAGGEHEKKMNDLSGGKARRRHDWDSI